MFLNAKKNYYTILITALTFSNISLAQLKIQSRPSPERMVATLLDTSSHIKVSNIKFYGNINSCGLFQSNFKYLNFPKEGLILTNGSVEKAIGPNNNSQTSSVSGYNYNSTFQRISKTRNVFDTTLLEFDLIPESDKIELEYCFASEEYPEYINNQYNDIFVFLISSSLENFRTKNLAILDDKTPVSVNNINHRNNKNLYLKNVPWQKANMKIYDKQRSLIELSYYIQYDGLTKTLKATADVNPNQKYHFKIGITDISDNAYDSAVFIKAHSLKSVSRISSAPLKSSSELRNRLFRINDGENISISVNFDLDSSNIADYSSIELLNVIIDYLKEYPSKKVKIIGHTDKQGDEVYNQNLSEKRALGVYNYLQTQGINALRMQHSGKGETKPAFEQDAKNRRVEFIFTSKL